LLCAIKEEQALLATEHGRYVPIAIKVAPDMSDAEVKTVSASLKAHGIDGLIASNTTLDREAVAGSPYANEAGGLSGAPLTQKSTEIIKAFKAELGDSIPIIGVGGIMTGADALEKIEAGAKLVQVYSGFIYQGPALVRECIEAIRFQKA
jgi:dihydroorotate dehydrogenase